jgi:SAM-dependent methyltransferase
MVRAACSTRTQVAYNSCRIPKLLMLTSHHKTIFETLGRNPIHPFPARMAPGIALEALRNTRRSLTVLDPMTGSGTVLAVAQANGHRAVGVDVDPLAVLLAGVWTRPVNRDEARDRASSVLDRARQRFKLQTGGQAYPSGSDAETQAFLRYWFDAYARRQLAALSASISRVHDPVLRDVLWCGFSRLIITKQAGASLAMDLSHSRPHRVFKTAPIKPFNRFLSAVDTIISNCPLAGAAAGPTARVSRGDARHLKIKDDSIDLVLTSPPYLNAIDYLRCSKFSLVWMGYTIEQLRQIRTDSVGTEAASSEALDTVWIQKLIKQLRISPELSPRNHALLCTYAWDMSRAVAEVSRVLKRGGRAVYVVGDSHVKGSYVRNSALVSAVARQHGLTLESRQSRTLPANRRYLPPPVLNGPKGAAMNRRMRREVVVVFRKG